MKIHTESEREVQAQDLAAALANASPAEFAEFWFQFDSLVEEKEMDAFAKALAPELGANRKRPIHRLMKLMQFHEEAAARRKRRSEGQGND